MNSKGCFLQLGYERSCPEKEGGKEKKTKIWMEPEIRWCHTHPIKPCLQVTPVLDLIPMNHICSLRMLDFDFP